MRTEEEAIYHSQRQMRQRDAGHAEYWREQRRAGVRRFWRWMRGNGAIWALFVFFATVIVIEIAYRGKP